MVRAFCARGNHESVKCGVHGAVGALAALCAAYNLAACCYRRDGHLRINAVIYTLAVAWEAKQTLHHFTACGRSDTAGAPQVEAA
jgi:hypothetical protein